MAKVSIYTQVYNAGPYLKSCIDSVLAQTHTDWEHIIADAGSTDGSVKILREYAANDSRVKFVQLPENKWSQYEMTEKYATGEYYASLDHDDWWDPKFLESLLRFLQKNELDIAFTGVIQFFQKSKSFRVMRKLNKPITLTIELFAKNYEKYGFFANARWASLMSTKKYLSMKKEYDEVNELNLAWRGDTILMLKYISTMERIGIDNSALQFYRMHEKSQIHQVNLTRLQSEVEYDKALREFFQKYDVWNTAKQDWIKGVFLFEITDAMLLLNIFSISNDIRLQESNKFLEHPLTLNAMSYRDDPAQVDAFISAVKENIVTAAKSTDLSIAVIETFQKALQTFAPNCAGAIISDQFIVFAQEPDLVDLMLRDDREGLQTRLLNLIESGKYKGEFDLGKMLLGIIPEDSPLHTVKDTSFFSEYTNICRFILGDANISALDFMTGLLLDNVKIHAQEDFFQVYLNLAALLGQVPAFIYGKVRLAQHYLETNQKNLCRGILDELNEMGIGEQEEVLNLVKQLESSDNLEEGVGQ